MNIANPFEQFKIEQAYYDPKENYGQFVIEPLEAGYGLTLGNALRRVLLSSLPGASVFAIEAYEEHANPNNKGNDPVCKTQAKHEFTVFDGVEEDVCSIILNLKGLILSIAPEFQGQYQAHIDVTGPKTVTAGDIVTTSEVQVVNKDLVIAHVNEGHSLHMTLYIRNGRGYFTGEMNKKMRLESPVDMIYTDSNYSPITKANFKIENVRIKQDNSFEKLTLQVWTNGAVLPQDAVVLAAHLLNHHFEKFYVLSDITKDINLEKEAEVVVEEPKPTITLEDLELGERSKNCLKRANITSIEQLLDKTEDEMLDVKNLGKKSLVEIREKLASFGLHFKAYGELKER